MISFFFSPTANCRIDLQNTRELFFDSVNSTCLHVVFRFDVLTSSFDFQKINFVNMQRQNQSIVFILRRSLQ